MKVKIRKDYRGSYKDKPFFNFDLVPETEAEEVIVDVLKEYLFGYSGGECRFSYYKEEQKQFSISLHRDKEVIIRDPQTGKEYRGFDPASEEGK